MRTPWKHIRWMPVLMTLTILGIAGFQLYWLKKAYDREKRTLEMRTNMAFREAVFSLQAAKFKIDKIEGDSMARMERIEVQPLRKVQDEKMMGMVNVLKEKVRHENGGASSRTIVLSESLPVDTTTQLSKTRLRKRNRILQFLYDVETLQDTIKVKEVHSAYAKLLAEQNIDVPFTVSRLPKESEQEEPVYNEVTIGFKNPITYQVKLGNALPYLMGRISAPILLSLFLVGFTIASFLLIYRNLLKQRRLAEIKNEFISNITHELKTPIATVSVAIEALRTFNANIDPAKTKEYLDISANELQRLSMLVDKVLKLSMFEKKAIELKYEPLDMKQLVEEVTASMRLQFEKHKADVTVTTQGDTVLEGDRLHLVSVIFNLVDNALKYGSGSPRIDIKATGNDDNLRLSITDNGIGIPVEYKDKIFEKFFRVPTGNLHNAKGYGLGLSYVSHVVERHKGKIWVEPAGETGTTFIITIPKQAA